MKKFGKVVLKILAFLLIFLVALLSFAALWTMETWQNNTMDQIVFHITSPIEGTSSDILAGFLLKVLLPSVLVTVAAIVTKVILKKRNPLHQQVQGYRLLLRKERKLRLYQGKLRRSGKDCGYLP